MQCPIVFRRLFHSNVWSTSRRQKIEREMPMGVGWCAMLWPVWLFCNNNSQSGWSSAQGYIWAALFELDNSSVWLINRSGVLVLTVDCSALAGRVCVSVAHTGAAGMSTTTGRAGPASRCNLLLSFVRIQLGISLYLHPCVPTESQRWSNRNLLC